MSEPNRWQQDGAPPDYSRLLQAVRSEHPSPASFQRALVSAGIIGATSLVANSAASTFSGAVGSIGSAAGKGLSGVVAKLVALSLVSAGTVVAATTVVRHHRSAVARSETIASPRSMRQGILRGGVVLRQEIQPSASVAVPTGPTDAPSSSVVSALSQTTTIEYPVGQHNASTRLGYRVADSVDHPQTFRVDSGSLMEEMSLIDAARASLHSGNAAEALRSANDYNRKFSAGRFVPEALFLLMQASNQLGQSQRATDAARELIRRFPNATHVGRARDLLQSQGERDIP
jgi:hypothetical protein